MTHGHVADNLTIYGNNAYISGGECDLEVDTYMYSRATGKQVQEGGAYLEKNITINAYELDNLSVWGQRNTAYTVNVNLTDCDGKEIAGNNVQRVYISGTTGVNNFTITDCDFLTKATSIYSNADGKIVVSDCTFTGAQVPLNINHKADGVVTLEVANSTFTSCGDAGSWKQFAAPARFVNSGSGTMTVTANKLTFDGTVGKNGDILLGDGRKNQKSNEVTLTVTNTAANIQAQKPGYYNDDGTTNETKGGTLVAVATESYTTTVEDLAPEKGSEKNPYTLEELGAMTRAEYIAAQEKLGGTMYVTVGNYSYDKNGVLGNGVRNNTPGQVPDHSKLNAYGENGYLGAMNDGANGKNIVFVGGSITSGATGYTSIDNIGTSLLLAVPAYTNVTFKGTTFKNVMSFDYQLYTSPWSQLGELKFDGCTFNGLIVGAIASQTLTFNGCTFTNYTNTTSANNSNPTWIRPAYGNWTKGDNEGQGGDFKSLTTINFTGNNVTSTRPVKFERIAQWEMATTVTAANNEFTISAQDGDTSTKNVGLYLGANAKFDLKVENNTKLGSTAALYTAVYSAPSNASYAGLPAGSTVTDTKGNGVTVEDAYEWKTTTKLTLETTTEVASVTNAKGVTVNFATLQAAIAAAKDGETVKLLADCSGNGIQIKENTFTTKGLIVDFGGHTYTVGGVLVGSAGTGTNAFQLLKGNKITFQNGTIKGVSEGTKPAEDTPNWHGAPAIVIQNYCDLTLKNMTVSGGDETVYTMSNNNGDVVIEDTTINAGKAQGSTSAFAFDVCRYASYPSVSVTVRGNSVINGNIEISGAIGEGQNRQLNVENGTFNGTFSVSGNVPANIAISGGTFSSEVNKDYLADGFVINQNENKTYGVREGSGFAGANVVVTESLAMKVVVGTASKYVVVTYKGLDGIAKTVRLDKFTDIRIEGKDYKYCLFDQIMPQMIDVKFSFELYGENDVMLDRKANYSVVDYLADIIKSNKDSAKFRNVAASLIEYANKAMAVKGLTTTVAPTFVDKDGNTVTLDYNAFVAKNKIPAKDTLGAISEGSGQVIYKARVVFDDAYTLKFYTNAGDGKYTYTLSKNGSTEEEDITFDKNGEFTINVLAQDITTQYVIKVYGEDKTKPIQTVTYGVSTYCIRMQGTETPQGELYVASYYYGVAVQQYGAPNTASV